MCTELQPVSGGAWKHSWVQWGVISLRENFQCLMGHQTKQAFLSHPSIHPSWLGVALVLTSTICVYKSRSLFMCLQLSFVGVTGTWITETSCSCVYVYVLWSHLIMLEQLTRFSLLLCSARECPSHRGEPCYREQLLGPNVLHKSFPCFHAVIFEVVLNGNVLNILN